MNRTLNSFNNLQLSEQNVSDLINTSAKKSCVLDPMLTCLIYDSLDVLLPVTTRMVNASLSLGHFPDEWKETVVNPLLKKVRGTLTTIIYGQSVIFNIICFEDYERAVLICLYNRKWTLSRIKISIQKCTWYRDGTVKNS